MDRERGMDGNKKVNGRKRHMIVDTLGLCWGVVIHAADVSDGQKAHLLVEHCLGYLDRMQKILVDQAYRGTFKDWVESNIAGLEVEIASRPPSEKGFVPVKWRWVSERTFGWLNRSGDPVLPKAFEGFRENTSKCRSHKLKFLHFDPKILSIHFSKNATLKDRKLKEVQRFEVQLNTTTKNFIAQARQSFALPLPALPISIKILRQPSFQSFSSVRAILSKFRLRAEASKISR